MTIMRTLTVVLALFAAASLAVACQPPGSSVSLGTPTQAPFPDPASAAPPPAPATPPDDEEPPPKRSSKPDDDEAPAPDDPPDDRPPPQPPVQPQQGGADPYDEMIGAFGSNNNPDDNKPRVMDPWTVPGRPTGEDFRQGVDRPPPYPGGGSHQGGGGGGGGAGGGAEGHHHPGGR